ncbi:MAG TPA: flavodoxin [Xanthobacteraceae bacterium]|nr:flavodoxin [Xanthobacteraceae bacterium]
MADSRILIVYYSRSGTTRKVAKSLAAALTCDSEEILDLKSRTGFLGYMRSLLEARRQTPAAIAAPVRNPSSYDLIIIGTPVWVWSVSSPVRAYLAANKARLPAVAFFCTLGGAGSDHAFAQMQDLAGKSPRACLGLTARDAAAGGYEPRLARFVQALQPPASAAPTAASAA